MRQVVVLMAFFTLAAFGGVARAQEALRYDIPVGHSWAFEEVSQTDIVLTITGGGQNFDARQTGTGLMKGTITVLAVRDGVPTSARIAFDPASGRESTSMGQAQPPVPFALAGRTVLLTVGEDGAFTIEPAEALDQAGPLPELTEDDRLSVKELVVPDPGFPPKQPIEAGSRWTATLGSDRENTTLEMAFEVLGFTQVDGVRLVRLSARGAYKREEEGSTVTADLTGTMLVDMATGLPARTNLTGPVTTSSTVEQQGITYALNGTGTLTQRGSQRVVAAKEQSAPAAEGANKPPHVEGWSTFTEPASGASFQHPGSWSVQAGAQGVMIYPEGFDANRELIVGAGMPAPGVSSATDARVGQQLDATVAQYAPMLERSGEPEALAAFGGDGAMYTYRGTMPDGTKAMSVALVRVGDGVAMSLSALGHSEVIERRLPTLKTMFSTLHVAKPEPVAAGGTAQTDDRRLIGMFGGEATAGGVDVGVTVSTRLVYALGADGVVLYGAQSAMSGSGRDYTGDLVWTATGETAGNVERGRWSAKGGVLSVQWDGGGRSVFAYGFEPDGSLVLRDPQTRKLINYFERIR